ncbi:hypothetical protein AQS70_21715 [Pseudomonas endophytica]|uniref:Uncharacterized protein n=1 Tax=Pseudomonas endophytica TaxID=1563157 RepID=A0A0Q0SQZ0_9PSED|nr:hypothetical protein [Pseudomonas endophytica]KQB54482.1 hypothetical protein AQS70_21715 [Pseudomonas endophytica]
MNQEIEDLIRDIWQSENPVRRAEELGQGLNQGAQAGIQDIISKIRARAIARASLASSTDANSIDEGAISIDNASNKHSLLLLYFAMYDSDSLADYSVDARERCLKGWSEQTDFPIEVIREAVILGVNGLRSLI